MPPRVRYVVLVGTGQVLAFIVGLMVVRTTGRADYAAYSATMAAVGAVLTVADSGTGSVLTARLASSDMSLMRRGALLQGAFAIRRRVIVPVFLVLGVVLVFVLANLHQPVVLVVASLLTLGVLTSSTLYRSLLTTDLQIQRQFIPVAAADTSANLVRLLLIAAAALLQGGGHTPLVFLLLVALAASFVQTRVAGRASPFHPLRRGGSPEGLSAYKRAVQQTLPWTVLAIFGDQYVNILLSINHNAIAIAEVSALTRYALAFNLINSLVGPIFMSRVALVQSGRRDVSRAVMFTIIGGITVGASYVGGMWIFRRLLLDLLGPAYNHLDTPFLILAAASALQFMNTYVLGLAVHARGWTRGNWIYGPCLILWVIWATVVVQPTTTIQAATVVLSLQIPSFISQASRILLGLNSTPRSSS